MLDFLVFCISIYAFSLLGFLLFFREYESVAIIFYIPLVIVFWVPVLYVYFGGQSYLKFGSESFYYFIITFFFAITSSYIFFFFRCFCFENRNNKPVLSSPLVGGALAGSYLVFFLLICLGVLIYHWDDWPFLKAISGLIVDRPDIVHGDFENYFLISVLFQVVIPFSYFHFYRFVSDKIFLNAFLFLLTCFFLVVSGNKAVLFFFLVFCFVFLFQGFSVIRLLFFSLISLLVYFIMKGGLSDYEIIASIGESAVRRLFVTQGMGVPNAFELHFSGFDFYSYTSNEVKSAIFKHVYGYLPGSMPVFYIAEAYIRWGWLALLMASTLSPILLALISVFVEKSRNLAFGWVYYYFVYAFMMSGFSLSNGYRFIFCALFVVGYIFLRSVRINRPLYVLAKN